MGRSYGACEDSSLSARPFGRSRADAKGSSAFQMGDQIREGDHLAMIASEWRTTEINSFVTAVRTGTC